MLREWEADAVAYPKGARINNGRLFGAGLDTVTPSAAGNSESVYSPTGNITVVGDVSIGIHEWWDYLPTQPASWEVLAANPDVVDRDVITAGLSVVLLPNGQREKNYNVY